MEEVKPVMVKFIETKYVHADAAHFKSVVQSLTGKDSAAAAAQSPVAMGADGVRHRQIGRVATARGGGGAFLDPMPSIEEMDEFFKD
ncbi:hypothetical protein PVAP13_3NG040300 [Panicum virgatum]|uniref:VQ domain-containing protein n=1 Tax=Panicum virgatum TaxID=38727 RepID=A0A8T0U133_PANVG|nr:hypothetical protein PVAP13_3NG040300 [Panicum virgatum]